MFERIVYIGDRTANVKIRDGVDLTLNLMNLHVVFEDKDKQILGEVDDIDGRIVKIRFLGEIVDGRVLGGVLRKPSLDARVRIVRKEEVPMIVGTHKKGYMLFGASPFYNDYPVYMNVNDFFSNHFAIFGNSGSGKSCGVSRIIQNMFLDKRLFPYKANILLFDSSGEYYNAFKDINKIDPNFNYKLLTTNDDGIGKNLRIPIYLLNKEDLVLLLQCTDHSQIPIIERMLKLALVFSENNAVDTEAFKNHLIAKAIMSILYTNETAPNKRNEIFSILASCSTKEFEPEAVIEGVGYTRKLRECFLIDREGQFTESVLFNDYVSGFIKDEYDTYEPKGGVYYNLDTLEKALNFTLISEGWLRNENTYGDAVTLKVRLHSLIVGQYAKYFDVPDYISLEQYLSSMLIDNGKKYQIVNINLDDVDDDFAKVVVKVLSRMCFEFTKSLQNRASIPFHIIVEEAHRYIQNDKDRFLIGYNIFDRIAKEGRKYGILIGLISQRPVELSDTVISQCSNFLIFKMNHPTDVDYIRKMVPNISDEIVEKQKSLQAGTCLAFGMSFTIPLIVKLKMPDPMPSSGNCDVVTIWNGNRSIDESEIDSEDIPLPDIPVEPIVSDNVVNDVPIITQEKQVTKQEQPILEQSLQNNAINSNIDAPAGVISSMPEVNATSLDNQKTTDSAAPVSFGDGIVIAPPVDNGGLKSAFDNGNLKSEKVLEEEKVLDNDGDSIDVAQPVLGNIDNIPAMPTINLDLPDEEPIVPVDITPVSPVIPEMKISEPVINVSVPKIAANPIQDQISIVNSQDAITPTVKQEEGPKEQKIVFHTETATGESDGGKTNQVVSTPGKAGVVTTSMPSVANTTSNDLSATMLDLNDL